MQPVVFILLLATTFAAVNYVTAVPTSYTDLRGRQEAEVDRESIQALLDELEQAALIQDYTRAKMESWERFRQIAGRIIAGIHHAINGPDSGAGGFIDRN